jgi:alpha-galactosidase
VTGVLTVEGGALAASWRIDDGPIRLERLEVDGVPALGPARIVELVLDAELHSRVVRGYRDTAAGDRLVHADHAVEQLADGGARVRLHQRDPATGIVVETECELAGGAMRVRHTVRNDGEVLVRLRAVTSLALAATAPSRTGRFRLVSGRSEWLGEGRWSDVPVGELLPDLDLPFYRQGGRGHWAQTGQGAWTTSAGLPMGILTDADGPALAWQIESGAGWHWELADDLDALRLLALGPTDAEHRFTADLAPGASFDAAPATIAAGDGLDGAVAALTADRRRHRRVAQASRPIVFNDYMNTLMGQPSTDALRPLVAAAADAGAEVFCIDAGWFADGPEYWTAIGEWRPSSTRFEGGLGAMIDEIRAAGMVPGLWLEPEVVGADSPAFAALPDEAFLVRDGARVLEQRRGHLDLTNAVARAHLDEAVDRLVTGFGIGYVKFDYNIDPGIGTDRGTGVAPGLGLLEHARAYVDWLAAIQERHPALLVETCASGAMRSDAALLAVAHVQSTSDQQRAVHSVPIAAAAPLIMTPEQAGDWAYPAADMSDGETALTLVCGLAGRLYLSGFLGELRPAQRDLVREAVAFHRDWRDALPEALPIWPLGLPRWGGAQTVLLLDAGDRMLVLAWSRGEAAELAIPLPRAAAVAATFPATARPDEPEGAVLRLALPAGPAAVAVELRAVR